MIQLTRYDGEIFSISAFGIEVIYQEATGSHIVTVSGLEYRVKEDRQTVHELINSSLKETRAV